MTWQDYVDKLRELNGLAEAEARRRARELLEQVDEKDRDVARCVLGDTFEFFDQMASGSS